MHIRCMSWIQFQLTWAEKSDDFVWSLWSVVCLYVHLFTLDTFSTSSKEFRAPCKFRPNLIQLHKEVFSWKAPHFCIFVNGDTCSKKAVHWRFFCWKFFIFRINQQISIKLNERHSGFDTCIGVLSIYVASPVTSPSNSATLSYVTKLASRQYRFCRPVKWKAS